MLYTLNIYSAVCQLYLNKTEREKIIKEGGGEVEEEEEEKEKEGRQEGRKTPLRKIRQVTDWEKTFSAYLCNQITITKTKKKLVFSTCK